MTSKSRNGSFDGSPHQSAQDSQFSSCDELITFAQAYFASDFPNPEGLGCPIKSTLTSLVRSGKAPDNRLRSHIFGCSECFGQYQNALAAYRAEMKAVAGAIQLDSWWNKLFAANLLRPISVFVGAFSLVLLAFVGVYVWREYRTAREQIVLKRDSAPVVAPSVNPSTNNLPSPTVETSPSPLRPVEQSASPAFPKQTNQQTVPVRLPRVRSSTDGELIVMSIDLRNYAVTRGGAVIGGQITVPPARTRVILTLPEGSGEGFYAVSVVDASGNTLETRNVSSTDGKTLMATLNMQRLTPEKYGLRISREGEPPIDVPILVRPVKKS